jgi:UDP-glucose 6-dehydrogenase
MEQSVKLYGYGWVGKAMKQVFPDAWVHDPAQLKITNFKCDIGIIGVPTPLKDGKLDTSIVESIIKDAEEDLLIVRSAVNPGDCDRWEKAFGKNVVNMPEYLGETPSHPLLDETKAKFLIIGGRPENRQKAIELFQTVYNANTKIRQVTNLEAEIIKLSENRAIAFKVMQCQELYDICINAGIDYNTIREAVYGDDPRFNLWWTFIYPENRGFNSSKCLVKDVPAWAAYAKSVGLDPVLTNVLIERSNEYASKE